MNDQQRSSRWLLCDFHIHTRWSDGAELIKTVVDLYGASGFDAICITDHILDAQYWQRFPQARAIAPADFDKYLEQIWHEATRAWEEYGMIVIPGPK